MSGNRNHRATYFVAGERGGWAILINKTVTGDGLDTAHALSVIGPRDDVAGIWRLAGAASHVRYVERVEKTRLQAAQSGLGRAEASMGALIPIRKSQDWWDLTQEERRQIFEGDSRHISQSMKYLPAIARQLYHSRDLGEPFDFLTWFEFAPEHAELFEELVGTLRATEEWKYVIREVDIRLERQGGDAGVDVR